MSDTQTEHWYDALPRPAYKAYERIALPEDLGWFEVYRVLPDTYAIYEPGHDEEVISFLILGMMRAVLWDTGMGFAPIRPIAERLTKLPILAVNSHNHFDHVGGNWEFPEVYGWPAPGIEARAADGFSRDALARYMAGGLAKPLPCGMQPEDYAIKPWRLKPLPIVNMTFPTDTNASDSGSQNAFAPTAHEHTDASGATALPPAFIPVAPLTGLSAATETLFAGYTLDLGGRQLDFLYTPGHSIDSIMLLDRKAGILFSGDTVYPAALLAYAPDIGGRPTIDVYTETMTALRELAPSLNHICGSHNVPISPPSLLADIANAFRRLRMGDIEATSVEHGLARYHFNGFSITTITIRASSRNA